MFHDKTFFRQPHIFALSCQSSQSELYEFEVNYCLEGPEICALMA